MIYFLPLLQFKKIDPYPKLKRITIPSVGSVGTENLEISYICDYATAQWFNHCTTSVSSS